MNSALVWLSPLALYVAYSDMRWLRIPNTTSLAVLAVLVLSVALTSPPDLVARLAAGGTILCLGMVAFAARLVGGGDVKLLAAVAPFVAPEFWLLAGNIFALCLLAGVGMVIAARRFVLAGTPSWEGLRPGGGFPMGVSIALAMIALGGLQAAVPLP